MKKLVCTAGLLAAGMLAYSQTSAIWSSRNMNASKNFGVRWMSAVDSNTVWALPYDGNVPGRASNLFVKTGNGTTFTRGTFLADTTQYSSSNICALDSNTAYIAAYFKAGTGASGKILKTSNGGATWKNLTDSLTMFTGTANFPDFVYFWNKRNGICLGDPNGNTSGSGTEFEIYHTNDSGATWTRVPDANLPNPLSGEYGLTNCYFAMGHKFWFGTGKGRVYSSSDSGKTWVVNTSPTGFGGTVQGLAFRDSLHGMAWGLASTTATTSSLKKTNDGGLTWAPVTVSPTATGLYDFCVVPGRNTYMSVGANAGNAAYVTSVTNNDGATWTAIETGTVSAVRMLTVQMIDSIHGWAGNFADSITSSGATPYGRGGMNRYMGPKINMACPIIITASKTAMCLNDSVSLSASGSTTYTWSTTQNTANIVVHPTTTTAYTVNGTLGSCVNTQTVNITVTAVPTPTVTMSSLSNTVCAGSKLLLQAGGATTYVWAPTTGLSSATAANVLASPTVTTTYTLTGATGTCQGKNTFTITASATPGPMITANSATICTTNTTSVALMATSSSVSSFSWTPTTGLSASTGSMVVASPTTTTIYYVQGEQGACYTTGTSTVTVSACTGIDQVVNNNKLAVYPNPSTGLVTVSIPNLNGATTLIITDMIGKEIYRNALKDNDTNVDLSNLQRGMYLISVSDGKNIQTSKLIINN
ncbi:MAG: T9SS type A sorting domain-containing protein [Bacteroidetes bacterium]|nr:T9SS type A sorting domain-containing protein [Bacteroidota bacterium]